MSKLSYVPAAVHVGLHPAAGGAGGRGQFWARRRRRRGRPAPRCPQDAALAAGGALPPSRPPADADGRGELLSDCVRRLLLMVLLLLVVSQHRGHAVQGKNFTQCSILSCAASDAQQHRCRHSSLSLLHISWTVSVCAIAGRCRCAQQLDTGGPAAATHHSRCARGAACQASAGSPICACSTRECLKPHTAVANWMRVEDHLHSPGCPVQQHGSDMTRFWCVGCSCQARRRLLRHRSSEQHKLLRRKRRQLHLQSACTP